MYYTLLKVFFPDFSWSDGLDVFLVAILLYNLYNLVKGTPAVNILIGIVLVYFAWILVRAFEMKLVGSILGKFIDVGVIAIIIVFQQEVRRFLLLIGTSEIINKSKPLRSIFRVTERMKQESEINTDVEALVNACTNMGEQKTGALIIISRKSDLKFYIASGEKIDGALTERMLENIFFKNSPLHDGAVIINGDKILAARCVMPVTEKEQFPAHYGMRHRAAVGITEITDAVAVVVSEQTGAISVAVNGQIRPNLNPERLRSILSKELEL
ncbi:MAG: diadenylate cyclase CdaA [Bacteroidota bacterium]|jgi:diadenylate cyclase